MRRLVPDEPGRSGAVREEVGSAETPPSPEVPVLVGLSMDMTTDLLSVLNGATAVKIDTLRFGQDQMLLVYLGGRQHLGLERISTTY